MATFYGQVFGSAKTSASGGGTYASGLRTFAQSYEGSVIVELTLPEDSDGNRELMVEVQVNSNTASRGKSLFYGTLDEFCQKVGGVTLGEIEKAGTPTTMDCVESAMECTLRDIEDYARVSEVVYEQRVNVAEVWDDERDGAWATLSSPYAKDEHTLCFEGRTVEQLKDLKGRTLSVRVVAE